VDEVIGGVDGIAIDIERRSQGVRFKEVALNDVNARGRGVVVGVADEHDHLVTPVEERRDESAPDESGGAGNEHAHTAPSSGATIRVRHDLAVGLLVWFLGPIVKGVARQS